MSRKRIALVSHDFFPIQGGQGRNFSELYKCLRAVESEFEFVAFSPCKNDLPGHRQLLNITNSLPGSQLLFSIGLNFILPELCCSENISLILFNGGPGGILLLRQPGLPYIYCANHTYVQQAQLPGQSWKRYLAVLERQGYRRAAAVSAISGTTRDELARSYGLDGSKIPIIPVGIDLKRFSDSGGDRIPYSLLYVGRMDQRKGADRLIAALPLLVRDFPELHLYLIGKGPLLPELKSDVAGMGLSSQVTFLGALPDEELPLWYNRCSALVVPSLLEGLGITVLEGLACGIPVIATAVPGISSVLADNETAILAEKAEPLEIAAAVARLLRAPGLAESLSMNGLAVVAERYNWDKIVESYLGLFRKVPGCGDSGAHTADK